MCEFYKRDRRIPYNDITEQCLTMCDRCIYNKKPDCAMHGRNDKTAIVHEATTIYRKPRR
jgi:hypothetical protein